MNSYRKVLCLWALLAAFPFLLSAQTDSLTVTRERHFVGDALYGFMNGGSELFLEYGFKELRAIELQYKGENYSVEIYTMTSPEAAFGIYSLHTFKCLAVDTIATFDCHSRMQLQAVYGDTYFSIVYQKPTDRIKSEAVDLLNIFSKDVARQEPEIPAVFADLSPVSGNLTYLKGPVAATNNLSMLFSLLGDCEMWYYKAGNQLWITVKTIEQHTLLKEHFPDGQFFDDSFSALIEF